MDKVLESSDAERRHSPRTRLQRPVKLQCLDSGRLIAGQSVDVSATGLLIELDASAGSLGLTRGQKVAVALAWSSNQVLVKTSSLQPARIVRCTDSNPLKPEGEGRGGGRGGGGAHRCIALQLESVADRLAA